MKIYGIDLQRKSFWKTPTDPLNSSTVKKQLQIRRPKERSPDPQATCVINSCQHALALDLIQVLDGKIYFQPC